MAAGVRAGQGARQPTIPAPGRRRHVSRAPRSAADAADRLDARGPAIEQHAAACRAGSLPAAASSRCRPDRTGSAAGGRPARRRVSQQGHAQPPTGPEAGRRRPSSSPSRRCPAASAARSRRGRRRPWRAGRIKAQRLHQRDGRVEAGDARRQRIANSVIGGPRPGSRPVEHLRPRPGQCRVQRWQQREQPRHQHQRLGRVAPFLLRDSREA